MIQDMEVILKELLFHVGQLGNREPLRIGSVVQPRASHALPSAEASAVKRSPRRTNLSQFTSPAAIGLPNGAAAFPNPLLVVRTGGPAEAVAQDRRHKMVSATRVPNEPMTSWAARSAGLSRVFERLVTPTAVARAGPGLSVRSR